MPFRSKAQQRFMFAAEARGELPKGTALEWAHETPDIKKLPEHVDEKSSKRKPKKKSETLLEHVHSTKAKHANYKLQGERKFRELDIAIENKKGGSRKWHDPHSGESGSTFMHHDYGYIRLTEGTDGDHVDVYVGPNEKAANVFIVNQMKKPDFKEFDEQKVMLGFDTAAEAKAAYLKQYNNPKFFGSMKEMPFEEFKTKVLDKKNHGRKIACGDMLAYFQEHPEKLKAYRERQERKKMSSLLHMPDGTIFGGAAAESSPGFPDESQEKQAVSAGWIRERAVGGLAKRNIALGGKEQAQIARKAVDYARSKEVGAGVAEAREGLRGVLGKFKDQAPNVGRRSSYRAPETKWRPSSGPYTEAERANARAYDQARGGSWGGGGDHRVNASDFAIPMGVGLLGSMISMPAVASGKREQEKTQRFATTAKRKMERGLPVDFDRAPQPSETATTLRSIALPVGQALNMGGLGALYGGLFKGRTGALVGGLTGGVAGAGAGYLGNRTRQGRIDKNYAKIEDLRDKAASISPAMISSLQHGAVGAGIGAAAGGLGGMAHADPQHRGQGFVRGALVGAGLGAAGGAGVAAIKNHGAQQLSSLQRSAGQAHQEALTAHQIASKTHVDPAMAGTMHAPAGGGTIAGKRGVVGGPAGGAAPPALNTQGKAVMQPEAWGVHPPTQPPIAHDVAQARASSAGGRAEALRQAATTLGQQQAIMNRGINRGALVGAAAGTGLMGYMAVPRQYGGVGATAPQKTANDDRVHTIADRLDDVGIATLASPYIADVAAGGLKKLMLRGGRVGALAAEGHGIAEALSHKLHSPAVELGGLALVAPGVVHPIAKGINKIMPQKPSEPELLKSAAAEVGRVLANVDHKVKHSGLGRLALGLGAIGATGAALYGGKKTIDAAAHLATAHGEPARYVGVPAGMRPPVPAGT